MRIYIVNIPPKSIKDKINKLTSLFGISEKSIRYEICSKEFGINIIEDQKISHIESTFKQNYEMIKGYNKCDLLIDKTQYNKIPIVSQLPVNYIISKYIELKIKSSNKSKLSLIIESFEEPQNFEIVTLPVNFYFEYDCEILDLNDPFFQEDFNMFLSNLN
jgi:hypothetical protein